VSDLFDFFNDTFPSSTRDNHHDHISSTVSAKLTTKQMKQLERRGQWVQQQIIDIDRFVTLGPSGTCNVFMRVFN